MHKLIEIAKEREILVSRNILNYDKPDKVYIPFSEENKFFINMNDAVKIGTPLIKTTDGLITSPISGKISNVKTMQTIKGIVKCLEITNDYKEKNVMDPKVSKISNNIKKSILDKLLKVHFNLDMNNKKNLVLNCIDDEPYVSSENFYLFLYYDGFLTLLDSLSKIYNFKTITICVKSSNSENINKLMECLGMYPNIKLDIVPNLYLLGKSKIILEYLNFQEAETLVLKASFFYHIYNLIQRNREVSDKLITISGYSVKNPSIIRVKIGTKLGDVLSSLIDLRSEDHEFIVGGLMTGEALTDIKDFIISLDFDSLIVMPKKEIPKEGECLNCGSCLNICPVNINPLLLENKSYYEKIVNKCLKCGLCSYICPVYINFNKYLKGDPNEKNTNAS